MGAWLFGLDVHKTRRLQHATPRDALAGCCSVSRIATMRIFVAMPDFMNTVLDVSFGFLTSPCPFHSSPRPCKNSLHSFEPIHNRSSVTSEMIPSGFWSRLASFVLLYIYAFRYSSCHVSFSSHRHTRSSRGQQLPSPKKDS